KQAGVLGFRIVANGKDDAEALQAARDYLKAPRNARELARRARRGLPPPPLPAAGKPAFTVRLGDQTTRHTYSWVELCRAERYALYAPIVTGRQAAFAQGRTRGDEDSTLKKVDRGVSDKALAGSV